MSTTPLRLCVGHNAARRRRNRLALCALTAGLAFVAGCGGETQPPPDKPITLKPPATPTAADCGLTGDGTARDADRPPKPGTYLFRTTGKRALIGERTRVTRLPSETKMIVTAALSDGAQSCFATQHRYESDLGETGVFVINGNDTYLRTGRFQAGADVTEITPDPPLLIMSGSELEWSGEFRGPTSGRYKTNIVGRKRIRVGDKHVQVVGIESRVSYSGEIEGYERSTRWISARTSMVVAESVVQERAFGLDRMKLSYETRLLSVEPTG